MVAESFPKQDDPNPPLISQTVAGIFAGFGLVAALGMGWVLARSSAGVPPFPTLPRAGAPLTAGTTGPQTLHVVASDLKFDAKDLQVGGPGEVKIELENKGLIDHDLTVDGQRFTLPARPGKTAEKTIKLDKPGTYAFFCSIPGHREAGMSGKITVGSGSPSVKLDSKTSMPGMDMSGAAAADHPSHAATVSPEKKGLQQMVPVMEGTTKVFNLTASVVKWEVLPGVFEEAWVYNGQLPGPVIRVTEGDHVKINLKNDLPEPTVIHVHGPRTPNAQDGVPDVTQPPVPVGGTYAYEFDANPAGTYTYHTHHNSAVQEPLGLYGVLIIDPKPGSAEATRDAQYNRDYIQVISEFGGYFTINGHAFPATDVLEAKVGEKVRIRLVNLGQTAHPMHLHGFHFAVVGTDGYPVKGEPLMKDTINIAPGERYDLEIVADNPGTWVFHCHILSHVANQGVEPGGMITVLKVTA